MVVEEYDENGNPIHVLSSNVVYTEDHMMGQHGTTSQDHFIHATSSTEPYSHYTEEDVLEMQEDEDCVPPPQVTLAPHKLTACKEGATCHTQPLIACAMDFIRAWSIVIW